MRNFLKAPIRKESGFTMVEVLVALFVLSMGLLGLAMLQTTALRFTTTSYARTQATMLAYDIMDRMRANLAGFRAGSYDVANASAYGTLWSTYTGCKATTCNCDTSQCDSATLARYDLGRWYERQYDPTNTTSAALLPGAAAAYTASTPAAATITRDVANPNLVTVTMVWQEQETAGPQLKSQTWIAEIVQ